MTETPNPTPLTPLRKAAILLIALGEEASAEMMQQLPDDEVKRVSEEIALLKDIHEEQMEAVLREFYRHNADRSSGRQGGPGFSQRLLNRAFGEDSARRVNHPPKGSNGISRLEPLARNDPDRFARSLNEEHPQTIALIMAHLPTALTAELLPTFDPALRKQVAVRMARLDQVSPDVVTSVAEGIGAKLVDVGRTIREPVRGVHSVADLCNRLEPEIGDEILAEVEAANFELAENVRRAMFAFEDIVTLDDKAMKELTSRVDRKALILSLKGTSDRIKEHFTKRMSSRARDMLLEDLDALGAVKIKDVEAAQQEIIASVRELRQEGVISRGSGGGDVYVS